MYPPKKMPEEDAVRGVLESLLRAGLEAVDVLRDPTTKAWVVRLSSVPPQKGLNALRAYTTAYMRACGHPAKIKLTKFRLWISVL